MASLTETGLWAEALALPETVAATLDAAAGFDDVAALLGAAGAGRVVATGNGAALYCAQALWVAAAQNPGPVDVVAVPAGLLVGGFAWRPGDRLLVVSSSGELRDAVEALATGAPRPYALVTSSPHSTLARGAAAVALAEVRSQDAVTHTQAYCGNVAVALAVWARLARDSSLATALGSVAGVLGGVLEEQAEWGARVAAEGAPQSAVAFGSGPAWPAALEAALLLKEIALVPAEGLETREGATSGMYALGPGSLAVSLPTGDDARLAEAERICEARGARTVRAPGGEAADARVAALTTFGAPLALATALALGRGLDPDSPPWREAYYEAVRPLTTR